MSRFARDELDADFVRARDLWASIDPEPRPAAGSKARSPSHACLSGVGERATVIADAVDAGQQISRSRLPD
jgi:hypothetical protein